MPPCHCVPATVLRCLFVSTVLTAFCAAQVAQPAEKVEPGAHHEHQHLHQMNTPSGASDKCEPKFTYQAGPLGPDSWGGVCKTGHTQSPVDITKTEKLPSLAPLEFHYQAADLDMVNDCNHYLIKVRFPENQWFKVSRKPYRLSEIDFHEPGENAVKGKRSPMSLQLVHVSPEATFLIIEVPVVAGKENPVIKSLWEHIPELGKENVTPGVKMNPMDLLPADHGYYSYRGSLTKPGCNEGVLWFVLKDPIEMSQEQIDEYKKHYHNTARPLQSLGERPVSESR
ncbi:MAG TPA: carbonic anhydrase family protein [Candidatus Sulfotelmatobacter sp.]